MSGGGEAAGEVDSGRGLRVPPEREREGIGMAEEPMRSWLGSLMADGFGVGDGEEGWGLASEG